MLSFLFPHVADIKATEADKKTAEKKVTTLENTVERMREDAKETARRNAESDYLSKRDHERTVDSFEYQIKGLKTQIQDAEERADKAEEDADDEVERRVENATLNVEATVRKEVAKEVDGLKSDVARETAQAAAAQSEAKEKTETISILREELTEYQEFVKYIADKLPSVDMSKFNINVDVPSPEVTVVSNGGGKKQG